MLDMNNYGKELLKEGELIEHTEDAFSDIDFVRYNDKLYSLRTYKNRITEIKEIKDYKRIEEQTAIILDFMQKYLIPKIIERMHIYSIELSNYNLKHFINESLNCIDSNIIKDVYHKLIKKF